jgi:hypothetical protein
MNLIKDGYEVWVRGRTDTGLTSLTDVGGCNLLLDQHTLLSTPAELDITSTSANDTSAGTGARTLRLFGLGSNKKYQEEDITLKGNTIVQTTKTWYRLFSSKVLTVGSGGSNAGIIYVVKTGTGGTYTAGTPGTFTGVSALAKMLAGTNQSSTCFYTTPNYTKGNWRLKRLMVSTKTQAGTLVISVQDHANNDVPTREFYVDFPAGYSDTFDLEDLKLDFGPDTDIRVLSLGAANGGVVHATLEIKEIAPIF